MESPAVTLQVTPTAEPSFTSAEILPGRGMMTLKVRARLPKLGEVDLIASPLSRRRGLALSGAWGSPFRATSRTCSAGPS